MADRLIELLYENNVRCDIGIESLAEDIRSIFADVQPVNQWISADDRLPEECKKVIVIYKGDFFISFRYDYNQWYGIGRQKIDYWQPLPEPPTT